MIECGHFKLLNEGNLVIIISIIIIIIIIIVIMIIMIIIIIIIIIIIYCRILLGSENPNSRLADQKTSYILTTGEKLVCI